MADTPPGAGYVHGPYDHTRDVPPHQHGGTDAPECTTCRPLDRYPDDFVKIDVEYRPDPNKPIETFDYGTMAHDRAGDLLRSLRDRARRGGLPESGGPLYHEWRKDVAAFEAEQNDLTKSSPWNGLTEVPAKPPWEPRSIFKRQRVGLPTESTRIEGEQMPSRDEHNRPPIDTDELDQLLFKSSGGRRRLSAAIRQELTVLGLIPGADGFIAPRPPNNPWVEPARGPERDSGTVDGGSGRGGDVGSSESDRSADAGAEPGTPTTLPGRRDVEGTITHLQWHIDRGELLCRCYDSLDNFRKGQAPRTGSVDFVDAEGYWTHFCPELHGEELSFQPRYNLCRTCGKKRPGEPPEPTEPDGPAPDGHFWDGFKWVNLGENLPESGTRWIGPDFGVHAGHPIMCVQDVYGQKLLCNCGTEWRKG